VSNVSIFVVDDDAPMRDSLEFLLSSASFPVKVFDSATSFLEFLPNIQSGCVVTDIRMPGIDGIELLKRVKQQRPALSVIVITGHGDIPLAVEAMKLGATDFVEKPFDDERIISTVRSALANGAGTEKEDAATVQIMERLASLSSRERQVLEGLVKGLQNKAIARDYDISPRTVEVYRANVMTKMQATSLSELIRFAIRTGILAA
jgi:two-component system, LuxR family, response regulator FixJ